MRLKSDVAMDFEKQPCVQLKSQKQISRWAPMSPLASCSIMVMVMQASVSNIAGSVFNLVGCGLADPSFLNCRPSVVAAAVVYAERRFRGVIPFWPSMLAKLTGYVDMSTPELSVAIKAAQRLCCRVLGFPAPLTAPALNGLRF